MRYPGTKSERWSSFLGALLAFTLAGCDSNPTSPSPQPSSSSPEVSSSVTPRAPELTGTFTQASASLGALKLLLHVGVDGITVEVKGTSITTTVANSMFVLKGLPVDLFTLVFKDDSGNEVGSVQFDSVAADQKITIVVELNDGVVALAEESRENDSGPVTIDSPFEGQLSGTWSGRCNDDDIRGAFSIVASSSGSVSGSYSGDDSGPISGAVSNSGTLAAAASGTAGECTWSGSIRRSNRSLSGNGTWTCPENCGGTWSGS